MRVVIGLILLFFLSVTGNAQICNPPGQTPSSAFPVCGTTTFQQSTVPICATHDLFVPGCSGGGGAVYRDKNPYWYKFTCYTSGTLGFIITPKDLGDDYDWQLYDITGHNPDEVFTNNSLIVTGNWAGTYGVTGARASGVNYIQCASNPAANEPSFSAMPVLQAGHEYLLMVSHFTDSQSGYALSFTGGTAVITDPSIPGFNKAEANCGGDVIRLRLKKNVKCSSIASNGSDFFISPSVANVVRSESVSCTNGFDADSLLLQLDNFLPPGTYTLHVKNGTDGNTLLDYCDKPIPTTETIDFTVLPKLPTPLDSIAPLSCAPSKLHLIFRKPMLCSSIAADGSDFAITGSYPVSIVNVTSNCSTTSEIIVTLSQPLQQQGSFTVTLQRGSDGNTLLNECGEESPVGSFVNFSVKDTVNADFTYTINYGCSQDVVSYFHPGANGVTNWTWSLDDNINSSQQNPTANYSIFNTKNIQCVVTNGFCTDSSKQQVTLDNYLKADFTVFEDNCPNESVPIINNSVGKITQLDWSFGDGTNGTGPNPRHVYTTPRGATVYMISLTVSDSFGCQKTISKKIKVYPSCIVDVPNAFTPNGDGHNDFLYPLNAIKAEQLEFYIYNRWGQLMYKTNNWKQGWDGRLGGQPQAAGAYVWMLRYRDRDTQKEIFRKGTAILVR